MEPIMRAAYALYRAGFRGQALVNQLAIDGRESHYDPHAENLTYPDHSEGYGQINQLAHHGRFGTDAQLQRPDPNAVAQWKLSRGGKDLSPWKGPSGSWRDNITPAMFAAARRAAAAVTGGRTRGVSAGSVSPAQPSVSPGALPAQGSGSGVQAQRSALIAQWLQTQHDPNSLVSLATGLQAVKATPTPTVAKARTSPTAATARPVSAPSGSTPGISGPVYELFYDPLGGIKFGKEIGAIGHHSDHVHFASTPKTVVQVGHLAQRMGLHVGENPHFGGVTPGVHVPTSYHYRPGGQAIDVSGSAALMAKFYKTVKRTFGVA